MVPAKEFWKSVNNLMKLRSYEIGGLIFSDHPAVCDAYLQVPLGVCAVADPGGSPAMPPPIRPWPPSSQTVWP